MKYRIIANSDGGHRVQYRRFSWMPWRHQRRSLSNEWAMFGKITTHPSYRAAAKDIAYRTDSGDWEVVHSDPKAED